MPISNMEDRMIAQAIADLRSATKNATRQEVDRLFTDGKITIQLHELICNWRMADWPKEPNPAAKAVAAAVETAAQRPAPRRTVRSKP